MKKEDGFQLSPRRSKEECLTRILTSVNDDELIRILAHFPSVFVDDASPYKSLKDLFQAVQSRDKQEKEKALADLKAPHESMVFILLHPDTLHRFSAEEKANLATLIAEGDSILEIPNYKHSLLLQLPKTQQDTAHDTSTSTGFLIDASKEGRLKKALENPRSDIVSILSQLSTIIQKAVQKESEKNKEAEENNNLTVLQELSAHLSLRQVAQSQKKDTKRTKEEAEIHTWVQEHGLDLIVSLLCNSQPKLSSEEYAELNKLSEDGQKIIDAEIEAEEAKQKIIDAEIAAEEAKQLAEQKNLAGLPCGITFVHERIGKKIETKVLNILLTGFDASAHLDFAGMRLTFKSDQQIRACIFGGADQDRDLSHFLKSDIIIHFDNMLLQRDKLQDKVKTNAFETFNLVYEDAKEGKSIFLLGLDEKKVPLSGTFRTPKELVTLCGQQISSYITHKNVTEVLEMPESQEKISQVSTSSTMSVLEQGEEKGGASSSVLEIPEMQNATTSQENILQASTSSTTSVLEKREPQGESSSQLREKSDEQPPGKRPLKQTISVQSRVQLLEKLGLFGAQSTASQSSTSSNEERRIGRPRSLTLIRCFIDPPLPVKILLLGADAGHEKFDYFACLKNNQSLLDPASGVEEEGCVMVKLEGELKMDGRVWCRSDKFVDEGRYFLGAGILLHFDSKAFEGAELNKYLNASDVQMCGLSYEECTEGIKVFLHPEKHTEKHVKGEEVGIVCTPQDFFKVCIPQILSYCTHAGDSPRAGDSLREKCSVM